MSEREWVLYGAYGYTGELVAREAVDRGLEPVLAGRRAGPLRELAAELDLPYRVATLSGLEELLGDIALCLNCAGPFVDTAEPAVDACLATGTDYLDVTGEVPVFERLRGRDETARAAGVTLLPGVGFDVVPSDCLAARLAARNPEGTRLTLMLDWSGSVSPGTARTAVRMAAEGVPVREDGRLRTVRFGERTRELDTGTGEGPRLVAAVPWGDVVTAHHTTGLADIAVYAPTSRLGLAGQRALGRLAPLLGVGPVRRGLVALADRVASGPDADRRASGTATVWGAVEGEGRTVEGRVHTPDPYRFTALSAVEVVERVLGGAADPGYRTPATACGAELVLSVEGAWFEDIVRSPKG